jgi:tetraacyldisaccharide 4'-kinase
MIAHSGHSRWLQVGLFLPSLLYEFPVRLRNLLYDVSLLPRRCLPQPVISIGNLTVGGSGKTPLAIYLAQIISRLGGNAVLLSRGYGRETRSPIVLKPGEQVADSVRVLGDEPALAHRTIPHLWLGISADRHAVGLEISRRAAKPVFILDDGFQHRRLKRDLDILMIDRTQPLAENRILPLGTLREPLRALHRAGLCIINGIWDSPGRDPVEIAIRRIKADALIFHCVQKIENLVPLAQWRDRTVVQAAPAHADPAFLVAAIGNPHRFRQDMQALGIGILGSRFFRDHYRLQNSDWQACVEEARRCGAAVLVTTEKDAIKISGGLDFPLLVAIQSMQLSEEAQLVRMLRAMIEGIL